MVYGHAQAGDIIGHWIFEDLQKGFSALKWTYRINSATVYESRDCGGFGLPAVLAGWAAASWTPHPEWAQWGRYTVGGNWNPANNYYSGWRRCMKTQVTFSADLVSRSMDVYMNATGFQGNPFYDIDGWCVVEGEYFKYDEVADFSDTIYNSDYIGKIDTCPWALVSKDVAPNFSFCVAPYYICKWNFTHQKH